MRNSVYSVSQVNKYIKNMFLTDYMLSNLEVKGEVSNLKYHSSGHIYFTLKDEKGALKCVMFAGNRGGLTFLLKEGMEIAVTGSIEVYERDGTYQLYARSIREEGVGNLFEQFEKLKAKLSEQGMFDASYKRPIPKFVKTLGVVTAPTGAAVRDIIDVAKRRNPGIQIILYPAIVQGDEAPKSIVSGIKALEAYGVDVIICGRGGGSMEDLWGFNDEGVAQAIFDCMVPVISAVGHETDFTIADFVSDLRAPTPSAAAELAVCDVAGILGNLNKDKERLNRDIRYILDNLKRNAANYEKRLTANSPKSRLNSMKQQLVKLSDDLNRDMNSVILKSRHRIEVNAGKLHALSPLSKLSGGYSYIRNEDGKNVKSISDVVKSDTLYINVTDGKITAKVEETEAI